jgi:alpha-glucosidase
MNKGAGTIFKPMCFVFPLDDETYKFKPLNEQFMIGNDLMAVPILYEGTDSVEAYFPAADWYSYSNGSKVNSRKNGGTYKKIHNYLPDPISLFIKEGGLVMK